MVAGIVDHVQDDDKTPTHESSCPMSGNKAIGQATVVATSILY